MPSCTCGGPAAPADARSTGPDSALSPEPCSDGIRRAAIDVPPISVIDRPDGVWVSGHHDRVLVAQTDFASPNRLFRLTVGRLDGTRIRSSDAVLPASGNEFIATAIRGTDPYEVLFVRQGDPFAVVASYAPDGTASAVSPPGVGSAYQVYAAAATRDGFVALVGLSSSDWTIAVIDSTGVAFEPLGAEPWAPARFRGEQLFFALSDADPDGIVYGAYVRYGGAVVAVRIDPTTRPIDIRHVDVGTVDVTHPAVRVSTTPLGVVLGAHMDGPVVGARFFWLGSALAATASVDVTGDLSLWPIGVVGAGPQVLAFEGSPDERRALSVGISDAPGHLSGGARPLVNALDGEGSSLRGHAWESSPGVVSIAYWRATAEVVTLCSER